MKKQKVDVEDLAIGMYVCELDRSWIESPFLFQGFALESYEQIDQVREVCKYVYIDIHQSILESTGQRRVATSAKSHTTAEVHKPAREVKASEFKSNLSKASQAMETGMDHVNEVLEDVLAGKNVDAKIARHAVSELIAGISIDTNASLWLTNLKERHESVALHSVNTCTLAVVFARHLKLPKEQQEEIGMGALFHDIGMIQIPPEIVNKPGRLTEEEYKIVRRHCMLGSNVMNTAQQIPDGAIQIIRSHHERMSGKGYPDGLAGDEIPLPARIVAIADVYDSVTSDSVYKAGISPYAALLIMHKRAESDFGKDLIEEFIKCVGIYPIGSFVQLKSGAITVIAGTSTNNRLLPVVMLLQDAEGRKYKTQSFVNLASMAKEYGPRWHIQRAVNPKHVGIDVNSVRLSSV